ncbi:MAG: hypothetical protein ACJA0U_003306 [Salibacteraceae bacterium]
MVTGSGCEIVRHYILAYAGATVLDSIDIAYCATLGLNEKSLDFDVSSNPVSSSLTVSSENHNVEELIILDLEGRLVKQLKVESSNFTIDMSSQNSGMYLLKLISDGKEQVKRIVVQH